MSYPTLQMNGWLTVPWAEHVGQHADHGTRLSLSHEGNSHATYMIQVNFGDLMTACTQILGVNSFVANSPSNLTLSRAVPKQHPLLPWLYASTIQEAYPLKFIEKGNAGNYYLLDGGFTTSFYDRWLMVIGFQVPKFRVLDDNTLIAYYGTSPVQEWQRNCIWKEDQENQTLTREGGSFFWAEGPGTTSPFPISAAQAQQLTPTTIILTWFAVPRYGLYIPNSNNLNKNLTSCIGKVNSGWFFDRPPQTLLCRGVRAIPKPSPFPFSLQQGIAGLQDVNAEYDVEIILSDFDPPTAGPAPVYPNIPTYTHGWNNAPYPNDANGYWYRVATTWPAGTTGLVPTADFTQMFTLSVTP